MAKSLVSQDGDLVTKEQEEKKNTPSDVYRKARITWIA
jgi:hypothetical protein